MDQTKSPNHHHSSYSNTVYTPSTNCNAEHLPVDNRSNAASWIHSPTDDFIELCTDSYLPPPSLQHFDAVYQSPYAPNNVPGLSASPQPSLVTELDLGSLLIPPPLSLVTPAQPHIQHYNSPSPTQPITCTSLEPKSTPSTVIHGLDTVSSSSSGGTVPPAQLPNVTEPTASVGVSSSRQQSAIMSNKRSASGSKTAAIDTKSSNSTGKTSNHKISKRHAQTKRLYNRPSPVFPSCSTPISMVGHHHNNAAGSDSSSKPPQCPAGSASNHIVTSPLACTTSATTMTRIDSATFAAQQQSSSLTNMHEINRSLSIITTDHSTMHQLKDIESRILKLQAERGRVLKSAQDRSQLSGGLLMSHNPHGGVQQDTNALNLYLTSVEALREIENGLIEEGNCIMFKIGKLYSLLDCTVNQCVSLCSSSATAPTAGCSRGRLLSTINNISDCLPYINGLIASEKEKVKFVEYPSNTAGGGSLIQLELLSTSSITSSLTGLDSSSQTAPQLTTSYTHLQAIVDTLNKVIYHAQVIQHHGREISLSLMTLNTKIQEILGDNDGTLKHSIPSIETRHSVHAVMEGNKAVVSAVQRIWEKTIEYGSVTLSAITESIDTTTTS